jgi:hypothetical protein
MRSWLLLLLSLLALGCDDSTGPTQGDLAVDPTWVTGATAQALDATNHR